MDLRSPAIILVRHGATGWSEAGRLTTRTDIPLSPYGVSEARAAAAALSAIHIDRIISSPMQRAKQTAEAIASRQPGVQLDYDARLVEIDAGPFEGQTHVELRAGPLAESFIAYRNQDNPVFPEGAETYTDAASRIEGLFSELPRTGRTVVVTHGHVVRLLLSHCVLGLELAHLTRLHLETARFALVGWSHDVPQLLALNVKTLEGLVAFDQTPNAPFV